MHQLMYSVVSDLDLHCLLRPVCLKIWVNNYMGSDKEVGGKLPVVSVPDFGSCGHGFKSRRRQNSAHDFIAQSLTLSSFVVLI